ncbi:hypothetical protein BX600DRAFT_544356 [Xylariales sp. PMI_506]|nr:hypothetical protein BX600DRAFT_544356 [Xylariales sp. PMI_506]
MGSKINIVYGGNTDLIYGHQGEPRSQWSRRNDRALTFFTNGPENFIGVETFRIRRRAEIFCLVCGLQWDNGKVVPWFALFFEKTLPSSVTNKAAGGQNTIAWLDSIHDNIWFKFSNASVLIEQNILPTWINYPGSFPGDEGKRIWVELVRKPNSTPNIYKYVVSISS